MLIQAFTPCEEMRDQEKLPEEVKSFLEDDGFTRNKCGSEWGRRKSNGRQRVGASQFHTGKISLRRPGFFRAQRGAGWCFEGWNRKRRMTHSKAAAWKS